MKTIFFLIVSFVALYIASTNPSTKTSNMIKHFVDSADDATVEIFSKGGKGTGILVNRDNKSYIWTCGHVVENSRFEVSREVVGEKVVSHGDFMPIEGRKDSFDRSGELIESERFLCKVIKYSRKELQDLALLEIEEISFPYNTKFYLDKYPPERLSGVFHLGTFASWGGQRGTCAVTLGVLSQPNRLFGKTKYDLIDCQVAPGCSGGGMYLQSSGECIGLVEMMTHNNGTLINPTRRIYDWAEKYNVGFAINPNRRVPTENEWKNILVEDEPLEIEQKETKGPSIFDIFKIK